MKTANGYNHQASTVEQARRLREGGWSYRRIGQFLDVPHQTIMYWCSSGYSQRRMKAQIRRRRFLRIDALMKAGLKLEDVVKVMDIDFPNERWTIGKVTWTRHRHRKAARLLD